MNSSTQFALEASKAVNASDNSTLTLESCGIVFPNEIIITIHFLTLFTSLIGNTLLIVAFLRMKETILLLIANMAASDLLLALVLMPELIIYELTGSFEYHVRGGLGTFLCKICPVLSDASLSVSTQSLVLIAVERLLALMAPVLYRRITDSKRRIIVICTWIVAILLHSPYFYAMRIASILHEGTFIQVCHPDWAPIFEHRTAQLRYGIFLYITVLIVPILIISVLYTVIVFNQRNDKMGSSRGEKCAIRKKRSVKNLKRMAVATVTALFLCWTLYIIVHSFKLVSPETVPKCSKFFQAVETVSSLIASCYCAVNPSLCFIFIKSFSRQLSFLCQRKSNRQRGAKCTHANVKMGESGSVSCLTRLSLRGSYTK